MKQQCQPQSPPKYPMGFEKVLEQRTLSRMWIVRRELFFIKNLFKSSKCFHSRKSSHGVWSAGHTTRYFHTKFSHSVFVFLNSLTSSLLILSLAYQCLISSEFSDVNYSTFECCTTIVTLFFGEGSDRLCQVLVQFGLLNGILAISGDSL